MQNVLCVANLNHRPALPPGCSGTHLTPNTGGHRHQDSGGQGAQRDGAQRSWAWQSAGVGQRGQGVAL